jgi:hypothetical protein
MALPEGMKAVHRRAYDYDLVKPNGHGVKNRLAQILEDLNLRHRSEGKFIPHVYKFASVEQRRKLLSGLLDSDGGPWKQQKANTATPVEFTSVSEKLADDVRFLVQSLGGRAIKASRTTFYTHKGERRKGQRSYRIRISFASGWNPFILKRKADMYKPCTKFLPSRAIVRVDCIGRKRCQCISVAAPDGLYVTDDFIVTHNTSEFFAWAELIGSKRRAIVSSKNVRQVIVKETQRMGLQGIVVVNSLADLEREGTYYLMTYDWLKGEGAECKGIGKPVRDARGSQRYAYLIQAPCPHCGQMLVRPVRQLVNPEGLILPEHPGIPPSFTPHFGYMCINPECSWVPDKYPKMRKLKGRKGRPPELVAGAAWASGEVPATRKRYTDYARKVHWLKCVLPIFKAEEKAEDAMKRIGPLFRGRMCQKCGYVARAYSPMRYRRVNKIRWGTIGIDEIHVMKGGYGSLQGRALLALKAKHRAGLSGTLMPNAPADPYWPLHWIFGGGTPAFPYFRTGDQGLSAYNSEFTASVFIYDEHDNVVSKKATPYLKSISRFHRLMAPKMSRRSYGDPLVVESLEAAGLVLPEIDYQILRVDPSEEQARLMVSAIDVFKVHFDRYKAEAEAAGLKLNSSRVLPLMMRLRVAATVPDLFNVQLAKQGMPPIYNGQPGGAKLPLIRDLAQAKVRAGQKVVIFSFFREMQRLIGAHVKHLDPIVFDTRWDEEERADMIELFHIDPSRRIMVASPLSLGEGVDLSPANTVICADLLWVPGKMAQAWSRILKALPEPRRCEIYRILMHRSIDEHMWNVFYAKQIAQEQAFDRRIVTRRETAIDIQAFVDRVMASRTEIMALLPEDRDDDLAYAPMRAAMGAMDTDERE